MKKGFKKLATTVLGLILAFGLFSFAMPAIVVKEAYAAKNLELIEDWSKYGETINIKPGDIVQLNTNKSPSKLTKINFLGDFSGEESVITGDPSVIFENLYINVTGNLKLVDLSIKSGNQSAITFANQGAPYDAKLNITGNCRLESSSLNGVIYSNALSSLEIEGTGSLAVQGSGTASGINFGLINSAPALSINLPNATTISGGNSGGHGITGLSLSIENKGAALNFRGGNNGGNGIDAWGTLKFSGKNINATGGNGTGESGAGGAGLFTGFTPKTIDMTDYSGTLNLTGGNAAGNAMSGSGLEMSANVTFLAGIEEVTVNANGGAGAKGISSGTSKIIISSDKIVINSKNNSSSSEVISLEKTESVTELWKVRDDSYRTGNTNSNNITVTIPAGKTATVSFGVSSQKEILSVSSPLVINDGNITANVDKNHSDLEIKISISPDAKWELNKNYSNGVLSNKIDDKIMPLAFGENKAYINVIAENNSSEVYTVTVFRAEKSSQKEITKVEVPANASIEGLNISAEVAKNISSRVIKVEVSDAAGWKLYSDEECKEEITNKRMSLKSGENKAYIKVTAEDGSFQFYNLSIIRTDKGGGNILPWIIVAGVLILIILIVIFRRRRRR